MADVQPGQEWRKSSHETITIDSVEGSTVSAVLSDAETGVSVVWVRSPADFMDMELISGPGAESKAAGNPPADGAEGASS